MIVRKNGKNNYKDVIKATFDKLEIYNKGGV